MAEVSKQPGKYVVSTRMKTFYSACTFLGLIGFVITLINNPERAWLAYLLALFFFTSLALGGLFFTAIQHASLAGWSVNIRRACESMSGFLPLGAVAALVFLIGAPHLYEWLQPAVVAADPLLQHKAPYLNQTFFIIRLVVFFGLWIYFAKMIVGRSLKQDIAGGDELTRNQVGISIAFLLVFALSYSFYSVDLLMSVQPHWFSTIYGVYCFAGLFQSSLAFVILVLLYLRKKGLLDGYVTDDHMHDMGKYLFAFTIFWAYIAFSQYMLIWYANLPEETVFIIPRSEHGWVYVSLLLIIGKFVIPFVGLLPRWTKRNPAYLAVMSIWVLAMQYVDLYWLVYPAYYKETVPFSLPEILTFVGFLGLFLFTTTRFLSRHSLVPVKDSRIQESLHHHVVY